MIATVVNEGAAIGRGGRGGASVAARSSRWCWMLPLTGAAIAMLAACDEQRRQTPAPVPVMVKVLAPEKIAVSRRYSGSIKPLQSTSLAFKLSGTVRSLYRPPGLDRDVQVGDTLAKGAVIAELDEGDLRRAKTGAEARVAQLEARIETAKDTLTIAARTLERFDNSAGSVSKVARDEVAARRVAAAGELETAEHALADARVQLDQAIDDYENRKLVVPFDHATVAVKNIEPGERKAAHEVAFRLIDISTVYVDFGVPDTMLGAPAIEPSSCERISLGRKLLVTADAFEGQSLAGTVTKIAPEADPMTRTFLVELTLANPVMDAGQLLLRPGMIVSVVLGAILDREAILLPMTAIHEGRSPDELMVYEVVAENGRDLVKSRRVSLGGVLNNQVEVLLESSEVRPGALVAVTTSERLTDGLSVQAIPESTDTAATLPEAK